MLRESQQVKNYLNMILQSITNVVLTLNSEGKLSHINHPSKMNVEVRLMDAMKATHYTEWLGTENATFVADIERAFNGSATIIAQDYELNFGGTVRNVNYTIVQMTSNLNRNEKDSDGVKDDNGVVIVLEDISSEKRALMTLGR
jgi:nitrogen fixation/metabolism regulation signal transduction histidine kinase